MSDRGGSPRPEPVPIQGTEDLVGVLAEPLAVIFKYSPLCGLSGIVAREVRSFMADHPDVPVYIVDVIRNRRVSQEAERRLAIRHESPQALVLRAGTVVWHGSHRAVTAAALKAEV